MNCIVRQAYYSRVIELLHNNSAQFYIGYPLIHTTIQFEIMDAHNGNFHKSGGVADSRAEIRQHVADLRDRRAAVVARLAVLMKARKLKAHESHFTILLE